MSWWNRSSLAAEAEKDYSERREYYSYTPQAFREKECRNCKHWDGEDVDEEGIYQGCLLAEYTGCWFKHRGTSAPMIYRDDDRDGDIDGEGYSASLYTRFDFDCNRWEAK